MADRYVTVAKGGREEGETTAYSPRGYVPRAGQETNKTIYVGQLRYDTDERAVRKWFEAYGTVQTVKLIYDKETGRSKGFGFVSFDDERDARDALNDAGGRDLDGAAIKVNIAHGPASFPAFAGGRGRGRGGGFGYSGRGPGFEGRGRGFDRRVTYGDRYSPGRYSPRSRSRSRSPSRKHERDDRYDDDGPADKKRRQGSPSRSHSSGRSRSPSNSRSRSKSRSLSPSRGNGAVDDRSPPRTDPAAVAPLPAEPASSVPVSGPPTHPPSAPNSEKTPPGLGVPPTIRTVMAGAKPPPSAEAVKKELLRLRKQEQELGSRVRSLEDRLAKKESQLEGRDRDLADAHHQLAGQQHQLQQYKHWVSALLEGADKLASSRAAVAAAEAEAKRQEEGLAALRRDIAAEAEHMGADLTNGEYDGQAEDDAAWEQLAADIQESERAAAAAEEAGEAHPPRLPPATHGSDMALQAVMQEAAMDEDEPAGGGWEPANTGNHDAAGGRFSGLKFAVPPP